MRTTSILRATRAPRFTGPILPLDFFVNRTKALALYRGFIRASKGLGDATTRWETIQWIRSDFERNRNVTESEKSKTLLALGNRQLKQLNSTSILIGDEGDKWRGNRKLK